MGAVGPRALTPSTSRKGAQSLRRAETNAKRAVSRSQPPLARPPPRRPRLNRPRLGANAARINERVLTACAQVSFQPRRVALGAAAEAPGLSEPLAPRPRSGARPPRRLHMATSAVGKRRCEEWRVPAALVKTGERRGAKEWRTTSDQSEIYERKAQRKRGSPINTKTFRKQKSPRTRAVAIESSRNTLYTCLSPTSIIPPAGAYSRRFRGLPDAGPSEWRRWLPSASQEALYFQLLEGEVYWGA